MPLISVIVPVFNAAETLPRLLDSLAAQTWPDIEFLLVDDGSTDASYNICAARTAQDCRFHLIRQAHAGVSAARNTGLQVAQGAWLGFADSDDWLESEMFSALAGALASTGADCAMCAFFEHLPRDVRPPVVHGVSGTVLLSQAEAISEALRRDGCFTSVWNKLFRREVITVKNTLLSFDPRYVNGQDEVWLMEALTGGIHSAVCIPTPLYHWASRADSATRSMRFSSARLSGLAAKQKSRDLVVTAYPALRTHSESCLINDGFLLRVQAYAAGDHAACAQIDAAFHPCWKSFLRHRDIPLLRRVKVLLLRVMMGLHLPVRMVMSVSDLGRRQRQPLSAES